MNAIERYREKMREEKELRIRSKMRLSVENLKNIISNCVVYGNTYSLEEALSALYRKEQDISLEYYHIFSIDIKVSGWR